VRHNLVLVFILVISSSCFVKGQISNKFCEQARLKQEAMLRAQKKLKQKRMYDEKGTLLSMEGYDSLGRISYYVKYAKQENLKHEVDSIKNRYLKDEWYYSYDTLGELIQVRNISESFVGKVYGLEDHHKEGDPYSLPFVGGPWKYNVNNFVFDYERKFIKGRKTEQVGLIFREYHSLVSAQGYIFQKDFNWKIIYHYDESGRLISEDQLLPTWFEENGKSVLASDKKKLTYNHLLKYNNQGLICNEKLMYLEHNMFNSDITYYQNGYLKTISVSDENSAGVDSFNVDGLLISKTYFVNNNVQSRSVFKYDQYNNLIEEDIMEAGKPVRLGKFYENKYDENRNLLECIQTDKIYKTKFVFRFSY
jgi:hypothetical protein